MQHLSSNPYSALYGKSALELALLDIDTLEILGPDEVVSWIKSNSEHLKEEDLRALSIKISSFEAYVSGLLRIAQNTPNIKLFAPTFEPVELEEMAGLLVSAWLLRREYDRKPTPVALTPEGEEAATRRKWKNLADVISDLKDYEEEIVDYGKAILLDQPALYALWVDDQDDGTFSDAAGDVRRRLDIVSNNKALFENTIIDAAYRQQGESWYADAMAFYRGREGRQTSKSELVEQRDRATTMLLERTLRLQVILRAAYRKDKEVLAKIEGSHWKRLEKLSRPRKRKVSAPTL